MTKKELIEQLTKLLGTLDQMVLRHIDILSKGGLTYKEIARAVYYIYDVLKQPKDNIKQYGIKGLVPLYVQRANAYYDEIKRMREQQARDTRKLNIDAREVSPQKRKKKKRGEIDISEL